MKYSISKKEARRIALNAQGLLKENPFGKGKKGVLKAIERLSYVQIDTISVIERAHHHTLWTRVADYQSSMLGQLQNERKVFEYWSHAAAYLPMKDYRFSLPMMQTVVENNKHWFNVEPSVKEYVYDKLKAEGALQAKDFEAPPNQKFGAMWDWKPAKKSLA